MNNDPVVSPIPIHKPYWGVLARDLNTQAVHKPGNLMSLLEIRSQKNGANSLIELMKDNNTFINNAGANPQAESNKVHKKGK